MTDVSQQELSEPHTNGVVIDDGLTDEERSKMRPADIDAVTLFLSTFLSITLFYALSRSTVSPYVD